MNQTRLGYLVVFSPDAKSLSLLSATTYVMSAARLYFQASRTRLVAQNFLKGIFFHRLYLTR